MSVKNYQVIFDELFDQLFENVERKGITAQSSMKNELSQITKKMSQLIAKSWLPDGKEIKEIFLYGSQKDIQKMLKDNGIELPELGDQPTEIRIDWDTFYGKVEDKTIGGEKFWEWTIAYPPRPYYDVTDEELKAWVNNDDPKTTVPETPYIPLTF
ncbi:MAG: hypothetical protein QNJ47_10810 [Nostocaceae cyanobacterium]|nr:hypothetical protein [Nostocaceae cyanobacterium]